MKNKKRPNAVYDLNGRKGNFKRVVIVSDLHCGAETGLTPEEYRCAKSNPFYYQQNAMWKWWVKNINELKDAFSLYAYKA